MLKNVIFSMHSLILRSSNRNFQIILKIDGNTVVDFDAFFMCTKNKQNQKIILLELKKWIICSE